MWKKILTNLVLKMPRSRKVEVDITVFQWLRESSGWSIEDVSKRLGTSPEAIQDIESGGRMPTLWQLRELSKAYKRPLASFFLSEPMREPQLPEDYRTIPEMRGIFDKKTLYAIRRARNLQEIGEELSDNIKCSTKPVIKRVSIRQEPEELAEKYRKHFALTEEKQRGFKNSYELFDYLRDHLEDMNILTFQFPMPVEDARGFVLTDKTPNVIVVNSKDSIEARLFSMMHEFGHILLGETVIDLPDISVRTQSRIEKWCNTFASSVLLPRELAIWIFTSEERTLTDTKTLGVLSYRYKVSKAMLLYNMLELGFISRHVYEGTLGKYHPSKVEDEKEEEEKKGWGIPPDRRCLSEVGNKFVSIVASNYDNSHITYNDALNYLSIRSGIFEKVLSKARK